MTKLGEIKARWAIVAEEPWKCTAGGAVLDAQDRRIALLDGSPGSATEHPYLRAETAKAIAASPEDVAFLLGEVERLTKAIDRAHVQAKVTAERVNADWLPVRFTESERGQNFCIVIGALWTTLEDAKAGKVLP